MSIAEQIYVPWLIDVHNKICSNQMGYEEACAEAVIEDNDQLILRKIDQRTLKKSFNLHKLPVPKRQRGRPKTHVSEEVMKKVEDIRGKITIGVNKTYERINCCQTNPA